jgi:hypothetical protein
VDGVKRFSAWTHAAARGVSRALCADLDLASEFTGVSGGRKIHARAFLPSRRRIPEGCDRRNPPSGWCCFIGFGLKGGRSVRPLENREQKISGRLAPPREET